MNSHQIVVIGLGYVGLPLALHFAEKGQVVTGLDRDESKIKSLEKGESYIPDVTDAALQQELQARRFQAMTPDAGIAVLKKANYIVITVPTPMGENGEPDLGAVRAASAYVREHLQIGQTVVFESSTYPGTLEEVVLPILSTSGLHVGKDYFLCYSPERIDPGNEKYLLPNIPKVVSGQTDACKEKIIALYDMMFDRVVPVSSPRVAEMCKLFENIQRLINISLVNEMYSLCRKLNIDFYEALQAAATKPFGFTPYWPGPGIGGHCIPVDPLYFQWKLEQNGLLSKMIEVAHTINENMPQEIVNRVEEQLASDKKQVLVIGVAYKKDVNDIRESPALPICVTLLERGFHLSYHDPHISRATFLGRNYQSIPLTKEAIEQADVVLILTDHTQVDWELVRTAKAIVDTRSIL